MIFREIPGLVNLEKEDKWGEAIELLHQLWLSDYQNPDMLIRYIAECWYVLSCWEDQSLPDDLLDFELLIQKATSATQFGVQHFSFNSAFNAFVGYMIEVFPDFLLYTKNSSFIERRKMGRDMQRRAVYTEDIMLYRIIYYPFPTKEENANHPILYDLIPADSEWDDSAVSQYFKYIVTSKAKEYGKVAP